MADILDVRRSSLQLLASRYRYVTLFSRLTGVANSQMTQLLAVRPPMRNLGEKLARRIEANLRIPPGWLDQPHKTLEGLTLPEPGTPPQFLAGVRAPSPAPLPSVVTALPEPAAVARSAEDSAVKVMEVDVEPPVVTPVSSTAPAGEVISLTGLSSLQKVAVELLVDLARSHAISDRECIELLEMWKPKMP